jgi:hypothetical protein
LLGGLGGVRLLLLASSGLLGRLARRLLTLLGSLACGVLRLLRGPTGHILCLACDLTCLVGCLPCGVLRLLGCATCGVLCLARYLAGLISGLPCGVLHALGNLPNLICDPAQRSATALAFTLLLLASAGETAHGVLCLARYLAGLVGDLACGVLSMLGGLTRGVLDLSGNLTCLVGCLACYLLGLARCLSGSVLCLLGRSLRDLLHLLQGLLGSLVHRILDTSILGRLFHGALKLHVGVDHLLDLGLLVAFGELLGVLLQLFAVILRLALDPTKRLPVEVLGVLHSLLLHLLL